MKPGGSHVIVLRFQIWISKILRGLMKVWLPRVVTVHRGCLSLSLLWSRSWTTVILIVLDLIVDVQIQRLRYLEKKVKVRKIDEALKRYFEAPGYDMPDYLQIHRNGHRMKLPGILLVKGDHVMGDPGAFIPSEPIQHGEFRVLSTPLHSRLESAFNTQNDDTFSTTYQYFITVGAVLTLLTSILSPERTLPLLFASLSLFKNLLFLYSNARMYFLIEGLSKSQTPFDENMEYDEFDEEALPPTKDIYLSSRSIVAFMAQSLWRVSEDMFWNTDVVLQLGRVTFAAFLDKTNLLSEVSLRPDQLILAHQETTSAIRVISREDRAEVTLDYEEEDFNLLKGIGLAFTVAAGCQFRYDVHLGDEDASRLCPCSIAKALGFRLPVLKRYRPAGKLQLMSRRNNPVVAHTIQEDSGTRHLFALGSLQDILSMCRYSWTGSEISTFDEMRQKLYEVSENIGQYGFDTLAVSYRPIPLEGTAELNRNQVFLGFVIYSAAPRPDVPEFIHDLGSAGIRFVYFSQDSELQTKTFGNRLGLETDWNSCILFSRPSENEPHLDFSDPKSKIPRGVQNVRPHLEAVDDIPLRISLFAECDPESVCEMIKIYRENDEVVVAVGMANNLANLEALGAAHLGIVMEAPPKDSSLFSHLVGQLLALTAPIRLPNDCSPYVFTEMIREARTLYRATVTSMTFFAVGSILISLVQPDIYCLLSVVSLSVSLVFTKHEPSCMKQMPDATITKEVLVWSISKALLNILFPFLLVHFAKLAEHSGAICWVLCGLSAAHLHLVEPLGFSTVNKAWAMICGVVSISALFTLTLSCSAKAISIAAVSLILAETMKYFWRKQVYLARRRAKLEFNTRLGMHSPR